MKPTPYRPVSCDFHAELELLALRNTLCPIVYLDREGKAVEVESQIRDIYTRNSEEFILLSNGEEIRLDRLISVNGLQLSSYC